jgi:hypothetical protein
VNKLKLIEYNSERVIYQYIPEDKGEPGEVAVDILTGKAVVKKRAMYDETGKYGHNATRRVAEYIANNNLPIDAIQAWY